MIDFLQISSKGSQGWARPLIVRLQKTNQKQNRQKQLLPYIKCLWTRKKVINTEFCNNFKQPSPEGCFYNFHNEIVLAIIIQTKKALNHLASWKLYRMIKHSAQIIYQSNIYSKKLCMNKCI